MFTFLNLVLLYYLFIKSTFTQRGIMDKKWFFPFLLQLNSWIL